MQVVWLPAPVSANVRTNLKQQDKRIRFINNNGVEVQ